MAARKRTTRAAAASKKSADPGDTLAHMNVLLEDIRAQNRVTYEAVVSFRDELRAEMQEGFRALVERVRVLEEVVRQHTTELREVRADISTLKADVASLKDEMRRLRNDFDNREERAKLHALEQRVQRLEEQLRAG
jgi:chromosome segregation ATPase